MKRSKTFPASRMAYAGYDLCPNVQRQAAYQGAEFQRAEVQKLEAQERLWLVVTDEERHRTKTVIVATGSTLKELGVPGETKLMGQGVSHCASCDGPLYKDKVVGVVGGGDSALQESLTLADYVERVLLFHRSDLSAQHVFQQRVLSHAKIELRRQTTIEEILGDDGVTGVRARNLVTGEVSRVDLSGLFIYVGLRPNTTLLQNIIDLTDAGHVPTDAWMRTARSGLYAVGDIRQDSPAQAITSAGDGATAAIAAHRYIRETFA